MAGFYNTSMAIWLAALVAAINFLCTFVGLYLVERVGRRRLTLISLAGTSRVPPLGPGQTLSLEDFVCKLSIKWNV